MGPRCCRLIGAPLCPSQDEANKIKKEASDLDNLIDKTEKEYMDLRDDLKGKEAEVRKLLEKGKTEQQVGSCFKLIGTMGHLHLKCENHQSSCFAISCLFLLLPIIISSLKNSFWV